MAGTEPRVRALRSSDPRELGAYQIDGRLGEGGMGSVFLAHDGDGRTVALKVIRSELAGDAEFRRRFRSEVQRARQVPPFCTAEVLDADTDHDPPYLVVEYVDGPSLSEVVEERGPLSPANQHGIALGVAVALTAIHGAGVIHRDLKPANVLLAPGSPKVIDFGIARAAAGNDAETRTDQVVGTVAYMAPERFGPEASRSLTAAADVFAWGAVVAYAATGRTPFGADVAAAVAIAIMSREPDLDGLTGPLRDLVGRALAKNPADRPTARELVDSLLTGGSATGVARPAAFAEQPEVLAAAGIAATNAGLVTAPLSTVPAVSYPAAPPRAVPAVSYPAPPPRPVPAGGSTVYVPAPGPRRGRAVAWAFAVLIPLLLAGGGWAVWSGALGQLTGQASGGQSPRTGAPAASVPAPAPAPGVSVGPTAAVVPSVDPRGDALVRGSLAAWKPREDATVDASCAVGEALTVTLRGASAGSYRCPGITDTLTDVSVFADVTLANANSCAGIWFRYTDSAGGYALLVCADRYELTSHVGAKVTRLTTVFGGALNTVGTKVRVGVRTKGNQIWLFRNDAVSPQISDDRFAGAGRVILGVFSGAAVAPLTAPTGDPIAPPFSASFGNVEIWRAPAA